VASLRDLDFRDDAQAAKWDAYRPEEDSGCAECVLLPVCYSHCPHKHMVADETDRPEKCPPHKYNWRRTLPLVLAQRRADSSRAVGDRERASAV
jgi:sulfatase maturation enzyme AslB (radical SAM superfamily)